MDRREFLFRSWRSVIQPVLGIILVYFSLVLIAEIFILDGLWKFWLVLALGAIVFYGALYVLALLLLKLSKSLRLKLSTRTSMYLRVTGKIIGIVLLMATGVL